MRTTDGLNLSQDPVQGFTLTDLLVALAVLAVLALVQFPSWADSKGKSQAAGCIYNLRQLTAAWASYAEDSHGKLVGAANWTPPGERPGPNGSPFFGSSRPSWAGGSWLTLNNPRDPNNWDHDAYTRKSALWSYTKAVAIWRCPSDPSTAINRQGQRVPRIRSYALNNWVGGPGWGNSGSWWPQNSSGWKVYLNLSDMTDPGPSRTFVFMDEREDSINDGYWPVDMRGYPDQPALATIIDYPTDWHNRGGNLSFADGHTENWRWRDPRTMPTHSRTDRPLDVPSPNNPDVLRFQEASTRKAQ